MANCIIHLLALEHGCSPKTVMTSISDPSSIVIKGVAHGWVHQPHLSRENLLGHTWDLFVLADKKLDFSEASGVKTCMTIGVSIPTGQYNAIQASIGKPPQPATTTPPLPNVWTGRSSASKCAIPQDQILPSKSTLGVGELRLDPTLSSFLSTALPGPVRDAPVSLFNLFRYKGGDRTVHDSYMEGFKQNFGDSAGAQVKFMGPYGGAEMSVSGTTKRIDDEPWQDANLVQYESIWHYAYMLSTDIYKQLNKEKVAGLDDTCILLVSEMELL